jgi:hypothetical protein
MEQPPIDPFCRDISASMFSHYLNTRRIHPELLEGIGDETMLLIYNAVYDTVSLTDVDLVDRAETFDQSAASSPVAESEHAYWGMSLLAMRDVRTTKYLNDGDAKTKEEAEARSLWELRQDVAARMLRLLYLEKKPVEDIIANRQNPELLKAVNLARAATRLVWAGFH